MRRALASVLVLGLVASLGALCPCPQPSAAADDHGCCAQDGLQPATTCCLEAAPQQPSGSLDAAAPLVAPPLVASALGPSRTPLAGVPVRRPAPRRAAPAAILRI
jgi:hypothetical protein